MVHNPVQELSSLTRRRLLRGAVSGATGLLAWHQWPRLQTAMAQKGVPGWPDDVGDACHHCPNLV